MGKACRIITLNGEQIHSDTWDALENEVQNPVLADNIYAKLETPEFKEFFGNWVNNPETSSMVKTENGEPLLVYHSSFKKFDAFDNKFSREEGFHFGTEKAAVERNYPGGLDQFGTDIKDARVALVEETGDFHMYPVFLNIRNMIEGVDYLEADETVGNILIDEHEYFDLMQDGKRYLPEEKIKLGIAFYQKGLITKDNLYKYFDKKITLQEALGNVDGYWYTNKLEHKGEKSYVVFDESNIKSIHNIGTFSRDTKDIYHQLEDNSVDLEESIKELDAYLLDFLKDFGVKSKEFEELKSKLGVDALGATDVLNKLIWYTKNRNAETIPEEVGHMAVMLMGENHPDIKELLLNINNWSEFAKIQKEYGPIYKNDKQVRIEALGKLIAKALVRNYKANGINQSLLEKALNAIKEFISKILNSSNIGDILQYNDKVADHIAINILMGNKEYINSIKNTKEKLNYDKVLQNNKFGKKIIDIFTNLKGKLTGSLALAGQGETIYRDSNESIHDIDFQINSVEDYNNLQPTLEKMNAVPYHFGWDNAQKDYKTFAYLIPEEGYKVDVISRDYERGNGWITEYNLLDKNRKIVIKNAKNNIAVDFFVYKSGDIPNTNSIFKSFIDIYKGKMTLSRDGNNERLFQRDKDQQDYILSKPATIGKSDKGFIYYQLNNKPTQSTDKQEEIVNKLLDTDKTVQKLANPEPSKDGEDKPARYKVLENGIWRDVLNSVTDRANNWVNSIPAFRNKKFTEAQAEMNEIAQTFGNEGHAAIETIIKRYFDDKGNYKPVVDPMGINPIIDDTNNKIYQKLESFINELINKYGKDAKFITERVIFDPTYTNKKGRGEAGTMDLIVIQPDGTASILDWKFMLTNKAEDIASYKQKKIDIQLERYKNILKSQYGITKFRDIRAFPIMLGLKQKGENILFTDITIGGADNKSLKLLPIPAFSERTGNKEIDNIINKLANLYGRVEGKEVKHNERADKVERLSIIKSAIRQIQVTESIEPIYEAMSLYLNNINSIIDYMNTFSDNVKTEKEVNDFAGQLNDIHNMIGHYSTITAELQDTLDESSELYTNISKIQGQIVNREKVFSDMEKVFGDKKIGEANNVFGLMSAEKVIGNLARVFMPADWMDKTAVKTLVNLYHKASHKAISNADAFNNSVFPLIKKIAAKAGNQFTKLIKPRTNELIDEYSPKFFETFKKLQEEDEGKKLKGFIEKNINVKSYNDEVEEFIKQKTKDIEAQDIRYTDAKKERQRKDDLIQNEINKYSLNSPYIRVNSILIKNINDEWKSDEYKSLDTDLREFFHKWQELNNKAEDIGYITYYQKRNFLPFMQQQGFEKIAKSGWNILQMPFNFVDSLNKSEQAHFGYTDNISGKKRYSLAKPFTVDTTEMVDDKGNTVSDYSKLSTQLGQTMLLYSQALYKYEAMKEIEEQVELVSNLEKMKGHLRTTNFGDVQFDEHDQPIEDKGNEKNWQYFDNLVQFLLYGNRYPMSDDQSLGVNKLSNLIKTGVNKLAGKEVLKPNESSISMIKTIDAMNKAMQMKTLGFSPISGLVNWFGGNMQVLAKGGEYYRPRDFFKAQTKLKYLLSEKYWGDKEKDVFLKMISEFHPLTEGETYELFGQAGTSALSKVALDKVLFTFMRHPEKLMQVAVFHSFMQNTIVRDGRLVNVNDYYKKQHLDRNSSAEKVKEYEKTATSDIEKLKDEESILKIAKIENGKLVIPGLTNHQDINTLGVLSKNTYKQLSGNMAETSVNGAKMEVILNSMMVFKNWIPKLAYTRFSGIHKVNDGISEEKYEVGRISLMLNVLFNKSLFNIKGVRDILKANENGLAKLDSLYEDYAKKYRKSTGKDFNMDINDFKDMIRQSLKNEVRELGIMLSFTGAILGLGFVAPQDDDKQSKAFLNIVKRSLDQFNSELQFYYNPVQIEQMLSGGTFPALGLFADMDRFLTHTQRELTGFDFRDYSKTPDEVRKAATPIKYGLKLVPGASAWLKYLEAISPDAADYLGVKTPNSNYSR